MRGSRVLLQIAVRVVEFASCICLNIDPAG